MNDVKRIPVILLVFFLFFSATGKNVFAQESSQIIVEFNKPPNVSVLSEISKKKGNNLVLSGAISGSNAMVYTVKNETVEEAITALTADPNIKLAVPNLTFKKLAMPNDPYLVATGAPNKPRPQWNMYKLKLAGTNSTTDPGAWDLTDGNQNVVIAILDDGVNSSHEDLAGKFHSLVNCARRSADGSILPCEVVNSMSSSLDNHGTHVAGLAAAATNNAKGIAGAGYNSKIMMINVAATDGQIYLYSILNALQYAGDQNVKVINMSIGTFEENITPNLKQLMQDKIDYVWSKGALPVAAAGNCGGNSLVEDCRITGSQTYVRNSKFYPAALKNVLSVAATTFDNSLAPYSEHNDSSKPNIGNWISVSAPGGYCSGENDKEYCILSLYRSYVGNIHQYVYMEGTSMASPQVAGVAALIFAVNPALTNADVKRIIEDTANPSIASGATNKGGVDALAAIKMAQGATVMPTLTGAPTATPSPSGLPLTPTITPTPSSTPIPSLTPYPTTGSAKLPRIAPDPYPTGYICPNTNLCPLKTKGDVDCNGRIDINDMMKWQEYYDRLVISDHNATPSGNPNFYCQQNYRETHFIDMIDYEVWRRNYPFTQGGQTSTKK